MSFRQKLQAVIACLTLIGLGLAAITLWATIQWQHSGKQIRDHYLRSLFLQDLRAATLRAFIEVPEAISGKDPEARADFEKQLVAAEGNFRSWAELAHSASERRQVDEVRRAHNALVRDARHIFALVEEQQIAEAYTALAQLEKSGFLRFEELSVRAVQSDNENRRLVQEEAKRVRELAQIGLVTAAAVTVGLVALLAYYFVSGLFRPLREIESALDALGRGDLQRRIPEATALRSARTGREDELSKLVRVFNRTVEELSRTTVSKAYLDSVIDSMADALLVVEPNGTIQTANPAAAALFELSRAEMIGRPLDELLPFEATVHGDEPIRNLETMIRARSGREITVSLSRSVMQTENHEVLGLVCVAQDISARKQAEQQIRAALEEKEVLFKEINHRVKNNLQVISSLLNLQARQLTDRAGVEALKESHNRVQAMALIHEMFYRSESLACIDFGDYIRSLTQHLTSSYGATERAIELAVEVAPVSLNLDTAIPCGLIINELVTNALKHAFPHGGGGRIVVELRAVADQHYCLSVRDNGLGLPADLRVEETRSLGLRLVRTLTEQLDGKLAFASNGGAKFEITLPVPHEV